MITAKSLKIKGLPADTPTETLSIGGLKNPYIISIPDVNLEYNTTDGFNPITEVKDKVSVILDSLEFFPETGLAGAIIYNFVKKYYKANDIKVPERDVIFATLTRLNKVGKLERVKRDEVWWYKLST